MGRYCGWCYTAQCICGDDKDPDTLTLFLMEIDAKLGLGKPNELLERIANSGSETAWQARFALTARELLEGDE